MGVIYRSEKCNFVEEMANGKSRIGGGMGSGVGGHHNAPAVYGLGFREHAGKNQGTCGEESGKVQGTCGE